MTINPTQLLSQKSELDDFIKKNGATLDLKAYCDDLDIRIRESVMRAQLYDLPEIKKVVEAWASEINMIDAMICNDDKFLSDEGKRMLDRKKMRKQDIQNFIKSSDELANISDEITEIIKQ